MSVESREGMVEDGPKDEAPHITMFSPGAKK